ncbi:hypothetical protein [Mesorhizobium captivum]|uniref:hypothetical protein n=1 Tax=Mesorhizobium captivum TaxID=3072319 RepID=UPI002A244F11|nr:hypothetical protein [Mesorhizobium sp. VK3C]MDX8447180.1 hypothetical protein [Mesorhizobium sp. VK3C]
MSDAKSISRTPPIEVRRRLRAEVGFGCPICGSPHLEYHHFNPTWAEKKHHEPQGMIALCAEHHAAADSGAFTVDQLVGLKRAIHTSVKSSFQWRRKHTVFACGGTYAYQCECMLRVAGINIVYFEKDENGYDTLSLNIYDVCMNRIFAMRMNDWIARINVDDIEAPPSARTLVFKSAIHRVDLRIDFRDRTMLGAEYESVVSQFGIPAEENVVFCFLTGNMPAPVPVKFNHNSIQFRGITLEGCSMAGCDVGVQIS